MDISHYYIERGEGYPLILLHGNGEDGSCFSRQMEPFSRVRHVYVPDTRGHGRTPRGDRPFTIRQFAEDLAGFMDQHGIEKADILGFSDGANIAMIFAVRSPDRVSRLILDGGNLDPGGVKPGTQLPIEFGYRAARIFSRVSPRAKARAEMLGLMVNDPCIKPEELSAVRARTLVMAGTEDLIKRKHTELIARSIPGAELVFIKGDHFIADKNPRDFNRAVLDFLRRDSA